MRLERGAPVALATVGALYLGFTAARGLQPFDSTEFALNAVQVGVGHPPGQPLYLLLSVAAVRALAFVSPSFALVLLSIAAIAAAVGWAIAFATQLASARPPGTGPDGARMAGVCGAGLAVFLLPGVWDMGTRAEVYPMAALLVAGAALTALAPASSAAPSASAARRVALVGLLLGLGASVNPAMAVAGAAALTPWALGQAWARGAGRGAVGLAALVAGGLLGLLPFAALPAIGANPRDALVWGEPLSGDSLAFYLAGRDYRAWHVGGAELLGNARAAVGWLSTEGLLPWIALGSLGWLLAPLPRASRIALPLGAAAATSMLALNHPFIASNPDYEGYLLPWVWLSLAGVALLVLRAGAPQGGPAIRAPMVVVLVGALVVAGAAAGAPPWQRSRSTPAGPAGGATAALASLALDEVPAGGILLAESDHLVFGALYLQEVERRRRDVTVINLGWTSSSWYWRYLARRDPSLPPPRPDAPSREGRVAAVLAAAGRPVAAERLHLAGLGGPPCMGKVLALAGAACGLEPPPRGSPGDPSRPLDLDAIGEVALARRAGAGELDLRLVATAGLHVADDHLRWRAERAAPFQILRAAIAPSLLAGLRDRPPTATGLAPLTRLREPRALQPPGAVLLRLGDLLADEDPDAAAGYYRRADLPEADGALAGLVAGAPRPDHPGNPGPPVAPGRD